MKKYTVYKVKDEGGASYGRPFRVSRHTSLKEAVKASRGDQMVIFRDIDNAQFSVDYIKNGSGWGTWIGDFRSVQNVKF